MRMTGVEAALSARRTLSALSISAGAAALAAAIAVSPVLAEDVAQSDAGQPMTLVVSLGSQKVDIYRGTTLITTSRVSTGKAGYATKAGVFSILEKKRRHFSNLYAGAPMPWMQRLTWTGTALHAGVVPGYPASHGCIRLPYAFAPKLFDMTTVGGQVVIARGKVSPKPIEHAALFQPLPPPLPPTLVKQEQEQESKPVRRSSSEAAPRFAARLPVVLAKAETGVSAPEIASAPEAEFVHAPAVAPAPAETAPIEVSASSHEDTRTHAIDPFAVAFAMPFGSATSQAAAAQPEDAAQTPAEAVKHQDRLAAPAAATGAPSSTVLTAASHAIEATAPINTAIAIKVPEPVQIDEPRAGPILTVSASALTQPAPAPVSATLAILGFNDHPPVPPAKPSVIAAKLVAGATAAAVQAAEPHSTAPLRVSSMKPCTLG